MVFERVCGCDVDKVYALDHHKHQNADPLIAFKQQDKAEYEGESSNAEECIVKEVGWVVGLDAFYHWCKFQQESLVFKLMTPLQ